MRFPGADGEPAILEVNADAGTPVTVVSGAGGGANAPLESATGNSSVIEAPQSNDNFIPRADVRAVSP